MSALQPATMPKLISGEELASMGDIGPCELIMVLAYSSPTSCEKYEQDDFFW